MTEGEKANKLYIVFEGEVELYKKMITKLPREIDAQEYKHEPKDRNYKALYHVMKRRESEIVTSSKIIRLRDLRIGKLFGVEDFLSPNSERKY